MTSPVAISRRARVAAFATAALAAALAFVAARAEGPPISAAEQRVFLDDHLGGIGKAHVLRYRYAQTGTLDAAFHGPVVLTITPKPPDRHAVDVAYLAGERKVTLPALEDAKANPVILYFLEQDVRDMHRRLGGSENYFRRRIRLAFAEGAEIRPATVVIDGKRIAATEVVIRPFADDPMKARLGAFEKKTYAFALSDQVPGQVLRLRASVDAPDAAARPVLDDVLQFEGAAP